MMQAAVADDVFLALSSSVRRKILEQLTIGPATVSDLAAPFDMKLPSFVQHLSVLENSHLVTSKKQGRVRTYELSPEPLQLAENWLAERRQSWVERFDRFDDYLNQLKEKEAKS
ncbi:MAG: metalloregulator ArsR/SmtB family transcription factor [Pseudomonadota bacterium]